MTQLQNKKLPQAEKRPRGFVSRLGFGVLVTCRKSEARRSPKPLKRNLAVASFFQHNDYNLDI